MSFSEEKLSRREKLLKSRDDCDVSNHKCLKCDSKFSSIKTLYFHMFSIHANTRVYYSCPVCSITFVQAWSVSRHLVKVHKKSKEETALLKTKIKTTISARKCKSLLPADSELKHQMAYCKTVTCRFCSREFSTPANLRRHIARHLGLARYWCSMCEYKTFHKSECEDHIKRAHSVNECGKFILLRNK